MAQEPDRLRSELAATRERMTATADALAYKADVKTRTKERVSDVFRQTAGRAARFTNTALSSAEALGQQALMSAGDAADRISDSVGTTYASNNR